MRDLHSEVVDVVLTNSELVDGCATYLQPHTKAGGEGQYSIGPLPKSPRSSRDVEVAENYAAKRKQALLLPPSGGRCHPKALL